MTPDEIKAAIAEAIKEATAAMAQMANDAATAHAKRLAKDFDAKLAGLTPPKVETPTVDTATADKIKTDPAMAALQAQIADMAKAYKTSEEGRLAAEKKARDDAAFNTLKSSLKGVKPDLQDAAAQLLFHVQKRVTFDEAGNPLFKLQREITPGQFEDVELPLSSGIEHWTKSEAAKPFLPAPGGDVGNGRGGRAPAGAIPSGRMSNGMPVYDKPASTDAEKLARAAEAEMAMAKIFGGDIG